MAMTGGDDFGWGDWGDSDESTPKQSQTSNDSWEDNSANDWDSFQQQSANSQDPDVYNPPSDSFGIPDFDNGGVQIPVPEGGIGGGGNKKISMKLVGLIVAGLFILVALVLYIINGIKIQPKPQHNNSQQVSTNYDGNRGNNSGSQTVQTSDPNSKSLIYIPEDTVTNYSGDMYEAIGKVTNKAKYLDGKQIVYLVQVQLVFGSTTETIDFWCNYSTYLNVKVGESVSVSYQSVSDNYISISTITK